MSSRSIAESNTLSMQSFNIVPVDSPKCDANKSPRLPDAKRGTWAYAALAAMRRVFFRIYVTTRSGRTSSQTANLMTRLGRIKIAHPSVLFNLLRCHCIAVSRRVPGHRLSHPRRRRTSVWWHAIHAIGRHTIHAIGRHTIHAIGRHTVRGVAVRWRGSTHRPRAWAEWVARRLAHSTGVWSRIGAVAASAHTSHLI
jgi:hypothetical protein